MTVALTSSDSNVARTDDGPLVTIAIPTFNRASLLKGCMAAALNQTYQHYEVLVSDNASSDETEEVLKEFSDPRIRVIRQVSNIGLIPNWNVCLAEARGEFIVFVPDDDRIASRALERFVALVKTEPRIPIVIGWKELYDPADGSTSRPPPNPKFETGVWDGSAILVEFLKDQILVAMCTIMIRTDALREIGGFSTKFPYAADMAAWIPLLLRGKVGFVNACCGTFSVHDTSATSKMAIETRITDEQRLAELVMAAVDRSITDISLRRQIKSMAQRHFARRTIGTLVFYRRRGVKFVDVFPVIWRVRRHLGRISMVDVTRLARAVAVVLCPKPLAEWIRTRNRIRRQNLR